MQPMRSSLLGALVGLLGLTACDDTLDKDGARGACASGGVLAGCTDGDATAEAACWRLVECGSYPLDGDMPDDLDWGRCMDDLERFGAERARLVIACIGASTCDELQAPGSPTPFGRPTCFAYGDD